MSITTEGDLSPINFLYPLAKRTRTGTVTAQLVVLSRLPRNQVLRRVGETTKERALSKETLIALVRAYTRAGDEDAAQQVLGTLIDRLRPAIKARVKSWRTVVESDREDAEGQIVIQVMEAVRNVTPGEEFWECNFTSCFDLRTITLLKTFAARRTPAVSSSGVSPSGEEYDRLAELPDAGAEIGFGEIEAEELQTFLSRDNPLVGEFIYLRRAGVPEVEIAARLGVTDRTLRNWKTKIRADLERNKEE